MTTHQDDRRPDPERLKEFAKHVFGALSGAMTSAMICLGDRLGLYRSLANDGPADSSELARRTGLSERWVREWLHQQGAARVLEYRGDGCFALTPEGRAVLADEHHPAFGCGMFASLPDTIAVVERMPEAFASGVGLDYDALGVGGASGVERGFAPWYRALLVPMALPRIEGVVPALERGARVADVGCGAGVALLEMAQAFPNSRYVGYDVFEPSVDRATTNANAAGVADRVSFHQLDASTGLLEPHDVITTFDVIHDAVDPRAMLRSIRKALRPDGVYVCLDINCSDRLEENAGPLGAMFHGFSVFYCMTTSLANGGVGLGTVGLHEPKVRELCAEAGFSSVRRVPLQNPFNNLYEVRL